MTPSPKHGDYNSLVPAAQASCQAEGMQVVFDADHTTSAPTATASPEGHPRIFFFSGVHADYHRPTDDFEKADFEKAARVARAAFRLGWQSRSGPRSPEEDQGRVEGEGRPRVTSK